MSDDASPADDAADDPDLLEEAVERDRRDRSWYALLAKFVDVNLPEVGAVHKGYGPAAAVPDAVEAARSQALVSAFRAMTALSDRLAPPPFRLDTRGFGGDQ